MSLLESLNFWRKDRVASYRLLEPIASGGMGTVWRAEDRKTGRIVAVKLIKPETNDVVEKMKRIFNAEEGEIALKLHHPNVVETYEYGTHRGQYYTVMEFIDGPNIKLMIISEDERIRKNRLDMCVQMGRGLAYIHQEGLVHRDFCPKNILYTKKNMVKIIDFGLTIPADVKKRGVDQSGTASYMAPEQIRRLRVDNRADIYAFGVSAFEILTGRRPFPNNPDSRKKMEHHLNIEPLKLTDVDESMPMELEELISRCIQKEPDQRYPTMFALMKDLRKIVDRLKKKST